MKKNIPTFQFVIDDSEESGVKAISIVGDPAFQSSMITFSKEKPKFVALADKKYKQICAGLSLIPDVPVYRVDEIFGEYYGVFSKETIEKIVEKYHMEMNMNKLNLNHDENSFIDAFMVEDFIVDSEARVADLKLKGIEHPNIMGAWYTAFKIKDKNVFESFLNGESGMGFSVEAYLNRFSNQINNKFNKMKKDKKSLLEKIVAIFSEEQTFERSLVPSLGFDIEWGKPGEPVNKIEVDQNGNEVVSPIGAGEFATDAGTVVVDESSNLVEVRPVVAAAEVTPVVDNQSPDNGLASGTTIDVQTGATQTMAAYPWDTCISDQLAAGYSQSAADKICGWIKANNSTQTELTDEVLKSILTEEEYACKPKKKLDEEVALATGTTPTTVTTPDLGSKTLSELVDLTKDGDYEIYICVEGGVVTEAEVNSVQDLVPEQPDTTGMMPGDNQGGGMMSRMKKKFAEVVAENADLKKKLDEPIAEPVLDVQKVTKPFTEMSAYEKALHNAQMRRG